MRILIAERLKPFCHLPGTSVILPGSGYQLQIFPCLIRIYHLKHSFPFLLKELPIALKGPIQKFTICNNLEKGCVSVWGETAEGWMRYHLISSQQQEGIRLLVERAPPSGFPIDEENKRHLLHAKEWLDLLQDGRPFVPYQLPLACDRLSLGNHKAQDWELVKRRLSLAEIFPCWHRLGQLVPPMPVDSLSEGTLSLLDTCQATFDQERPEHAEQKWMNLFLAGFNGLLAPQLEDTNYQGLTSLNPLFSTHISPLVLLSEGARLIRQLFVQQFKEKIHILPYLLPSLSSGRLLNVSLEGGGRLSLEWTKKTIRQLILYVEQEQHLTIKFRSHVRSYRLRQNLKDKGERKECSSSLSLKKNCYYFFDNFN